MATTQWKRPCCFPPRSARSCTLNPNQALQLCCSLCMGGLLPTIIGKLSVVVLQQPAKVLQPSRTHCRWRSLLQLRLPPGTSGDERAERIEEVIEACKLDHCRLVGYQLGLPQAAIVL